MKKILCAALCLALLVSLSACFPFRRQRRPAAQETPASASAAVASEAASSSLPDAKTPLPLGTAGEVGDFSVTVHSCHETAKINADDAGYMSYTAEEGAKYIVVNVTLTNLAKAAASFDVSDFKLMAEDDTTYSPALLITTGSEEYFTIESFNPGISKTGNVAFSVPEGVPVEDLFMKFSPTWSLDTLYFAIQ